MNVKKKLQKKVSLSKLSEKELRKKLTEFIYRYLPEDTDIVLEEHSTQFKPRKPYETMKREEVGRPHGYTYHDVILDYLRGAEYFYKFLMEEK